MKGLLLNEFYSAVGNIKLFLFIALAAAISLIVTGSPTAQELFVYITITALSVNAVVSFRKDAVCLPGTGALPSMFNLGIGISLLTGALFYPLSYRFGIDKSETILIISIISAILLSIVTLNILNRYIPSFSTRMSVFILLYSASFAASYKTTLLLYQKKEF